MYLLELGLCLRHCSGIVCRVFLECVECGMQVWWVVLEVDVPL
jgi:hypothetical protein